MITDLSTLSDSALAKRWFELAGGEIVFQGSGAFFNNTLYGPDSILLHKNCFDVVVPHMFATPCKDGDHFCLTLQAAEHETTAIFHHPLWSEGDDMFEHYGATNKALPRAIVEAAVRAMEAKR